MIKIAARLVLFLLLLLAVASGGWEWAAAVQFQRGMNYFENKDWYGAMTAFQSSERIFGRNPETHRWLSKTYLRMVEGRNAQIQVQLLKDAENELNQSLAIEPRYPYYWFNQAQVSELMEKLRVRPQSSALYCYRQAALIDPNNPLFLESLAAYLLENNKKDEAGGLLAKILSIDVKYATDLAEVWLKNGYDPQELVQSFSGNQQGLIKLTSLLLSNKQLKAAAIAGQKVYEADPKNPEAILAYGRVISFTGDCAKLKKVIEPAFQMADHQFSARNFYCLCLYNSRQYDLAEEEYLQLISIRPDFPDSRLRLAKIYIVLGQTAKAKEQLVWLDSQQEILNKENRTQTYLELARIFDKERNREQALRYYQLYRSLQPDDQAAAERVKSLGRSKSGDEIYSPWEMKK